MNIINFLLLQGGAVYSGTTSLTVENDLSLTHDAQQTCFNENDTEQGIS